MDEARRKEWLEEAREFVAMADAGERTTTKYEMSQALLATEKLRSVAESCIQELEAKRDEARLALGYQEMSTEAAQSRIQELQAHVGRQREALEHAYSLAQEPLTWHPERRARVAARCSEVMDIVKSALSSTPAESLERLKKLEAIAEAARRYTANPLRMWDDETHSGDDLIRALSALDAEAVKENKR